MTRVRRLDALVLTGACAALLALPASASASKNQELLFQDDAQLLGRDIPTQVALLNEVRGLGVDTINAIVLWPRYVPGDPGARRKPRGNSASPSYYPPEKMDILDSLVRETRARGMSLILSPAGAAKGGPGIRTPRWARTGNVVKVKEYERFVQALGRRYSGRFNDENGPRLPKVTRWRPGNEPNQGGWVQPQFKRVRGQRIPYSPVLYRDMYNAARRALSRTRHARDKIYMAATAPVGVDHKRKNATSAMSPGLFIRELACVDSRLRSYRRRDAQRRKCNRFKRLRASALAHHIYTRGKAERPTQLATTKPRGSLRRTHFPVGNLKPLETLLSRLGKKRRMPARLKIINTEFGFRSNPPDLKAGLPPNQQAEQENIAEYITYRDRNLLGFEHYLMRDDPCPGGRCQGFATGLRLIDGSLKPAYSAFAMPLVVTKSRIWGAAFGRARGIATQILVNGAVVDTVTPGNKRGYFEKRRRVARNDTVQLRDVASGFTSRAAKISRGVK